MAKVWQASDGCLYHDACFEEGESRDGYVEVAGDDLDSDDECSACNGSIVTDASDDDDDDEAEKD